MPPGEGLAATTIALKDEFATEATQSPHHRQLAHRSIVPNASLLPVSAFRLRALCDLCGELPSATPPKSLSTQSTLPQHHQQLTSNVRTKPPCLY